MARNNPVIGCIHDQHIIANQAQPHQITFKAAGGIFQRQATISRFIFALIWMKLW